MLTPMISKSRLLGLAFASADALLELGADGTVAFCLGGGPDADTPLETWSGQAPGAFLDPPGARRLASALRSLGSGERSEEIPIVVRCGSGLVRRGTLRAFRLPEAHPLVSCAIAWKGLPFAREQLPLDTPEQFLDRARAIIDETRAAGGVDLAFVDLPGLATAAPASGVRVESTLQAASLDGRCATRLGAERFALLLDGRGADAERLIRDALAREGEAIEARVSATPLSDGAPTVNVLRALRFTLESCLREDAPGQPGAAFEQHLKRTFRDAERFSSMVKGRDFALHWQPIVDLTTRAVHHFEGLARFREAAGPAGTIRMAEELDLIADFDLAVAEKAIARLRRPGSGTLELAVNVSATSLSTDGYVQALLRMTHADPSLRRRLIVEVTETAALADLAAADRRLAALRQAGTRVCIDDFGAGAASFDWLGSLGVDMVKIDGGFIRRLDSDPRSTTLVGHLAALCASLRVDVVAEMIETEAQATLLQSLGVGYGQGWHFGRATEEPILRRNESKARRGGAVEAWG